MYLNTHILPADVRTLYTPVGYLHNMSAHITQHLQHVARLANKAQAARAIAKYNNRVPRLLEKKLGVALTNKQQVTIK